MSKPMTPEERAADRFPAYNYRDGGNESRAAQYAYASCIREEVEPLELKVQEQADELAKLRALVRGLVDALEGTKSNTHWWRAHPSEEWIADAMSDAKEAGFSPTNTEDNG